MKTVMVGHILTPAWAIYRRRTRFGTVEPAMKRKVIALIVRRGHSAGDPAGSKDRTGCEACPAAETVESR